jgi:hypothetical protein
MNYEKLYKNAVNFFKQQSFNGEYTEVHHITPRYAGGGDEDDNLVRVTYRQHIFLHKVLWMLYRNPQDKAAIRLMSGIPVDKKLELCSMAGKIGGARNRDSGWISGLGSEYGKVYGKLNVESGFLDSIRHLANNETQLRKVTELGIKNRDSGQLEKIRHLGHQANREREWSEAEKDAARQRQYKRLEDDPEYIERLRNQQSLAVQAKERIGMERSEKIINKEVFKEEFLHKTSSRSKSYFVSPTGLVFESPIFAAKYYGEDENAYIIESWCKNFKFGWKVIPKPAKN